MPAGRVLVIDQSMETVAETPLSRPSSLTTERRSAIMLALMISLAILSQFLRSSTGVIAPDIMADLNLHAEDFGNLSSAYFFIFTVLQIPLGIFLDRYGSRRVLSLMMLSTIAGALVFAFGRSYQDLMIGRLMMGFGCAGLMVGSLVILSRWYPPERFTRVMALLFASANAGSLIATLPLATATAAFGWRWTFVGLAVIAAILTALFFLIARDVPPGQPKPGSQGETLWSTMRGLARVVEVRDLFRVLPIVAVGYASVITVLGLWGGTYLHDVYGLDAVARGNVLAAMAVAMIGGTLFYGPLDKRFNTRKWIVMAGAGATTVVFVLLAVMPGVSMLVTSVLLALLSFVGAYSVVSMAHGLSLFTGDLKGRGSTTLNLGLMGGAAVIQSVTGWIIGAFTTEGAAATAPFSAVFLFLGALTLVAAIIYSRAHDVAPVSAAQTGRGIK